MTYCFGTFEFDASSHELRRGGRPVAIEPQPARALAVLLARAGELITREELKDAVWGRETHVDVDRGLAYCISQVRSALGDTGDNPRFVQTIPKKGFRFIAPVRLPESARAEPIAESRTATVSLVTGLSRARHRRVWLTAAVLLLAAGVAAATIARRRAVDTPRRLVIAVSIFDNETGMADYDRLVSGLSDLVVTRLTELAPDRLGVVGNAAVLRQPRNIRNLKAVAAAVRADYALLGQLQQSDTDLRFITHCIRLSDLTHLRANRLTFPNRDVTTLEAQVVAEFERAVRQHVLSSGERVP